MLAGRQAFDGETISDTLAAVLAREPDLSALSPEFNPRIPDLLRRCLDKVPKRWWQALGDLRAEIETIAKAPFASESAVMIAAQPASMWKRLLPMVAVGMIASALTGGILWTMRPQLTPQVACFAVTFGSCQVAHCVPRNIVTVSPDGTRLVYVSGAKAARRLTFEGVNRHPVCLCVLRGLFHLFKAGK